MFITAGPLFNVAKDAYNHCLNSESNRSPDSREALVSVVFSVAAMESFMNEIGELAIRNPLSKLQVEPESVTTFGKVMKAIEDSNGQLGLKIIMASAVFRAKLFDKGANPYQDFMLLLELRNALVHKKPFEEFGKFGNEKGELEIRKHPLILKFRSKNILANFGDGIIADFTDWFSTRAVAKWSYNTAANMVQLIIDMVPDSEEKTSFKKVLKLFYDSIKLI